MPSHRGPAEKADPLTLTVTHWTDQTDSAWSIRRSSPRIVPITFHDHHVVEMFVGYPASQSFEGRSRRISREDAKTRDRQPARNVPKGTCRRHRRRPHSIR